MQFLSLVFLGILTGGFCSEDSCRYGAHRKCRAITVIPRPPPANEGDLKRACDHVKRFKVCVLDYLSDCSSESEEDTDASEERRKLINAEAQRIRESLNTDDNEINLMTEICQEDSDLRARYIPDMACLREIYVMYSRRVTPAGICRDYSDIALKSLEGDLDKIRETGDIYLSQAIEHCFMILFGMNCFLKEFNNRCNPSSKDTVLELIQKAADFDVWCPARIRPELLKLLDTWQTRSDEEIYVRNFVEIV